MKKILGSLYYLCQSPSFKKIIGIVPGAKYGEANGYPLEGFFKCIPSFLKFSKGYQQKKILGVKRNEN